MVQWFSGTSSEAGVLASVWSGNGCTMPVKKKDLVLELASLLGCFALAGGECTLQASKLRLLQPRWFQVAMTLDKLFPAFSQLTVMLAG